MKLWVEKLFTNCCLHASLDVLTDRLNRQKEAKMGYYYF